MLCRWNGPFDHTSKVMISHVDMEEQTCSGLWVDGVPGPSPAVFLSFCLCILVFA